ncbi:TPA: tail assembly protein [Proteus mirabilis]
MVKLQFAGYLRRFGRKFELEVNTAGEALRCLYYQIEGLKKEINLGQFRVRIAGNDMTEQSIAGGLNTPLKSGDCITIVPVIGGAKSGSWLGIIAGGALIGASILVPGAFLGTLTSTALFAAGIGVAASGLAGLLTKTPPAPSYGSSSSESNKYFNSLSNRMGQGHPVPICYGEMVIGSNVISQGMEVV